MHQLKASEPDRISPLIFTDLDGTLLDHDTYSWAAAAPLLKRLEKLGIPVIFNSSKTVSEMKNLREAMKLSHPFIAENGAVIAFPEGYPEKNGAGLQFEFLGRARREILEVLTWAREEEGFRFQGFNDMSLQEIIRHTGLSSEEALAASERQATEPLLWFDTEENKARLERMLKKNELRLLSGGRFLHVMGTCDKANALAHLTRRYQTDWQYSVNTTIALGDSPNDQEMLNAADVAVIMAPSDAPPFHAQGKRETIYAGGRGPACWASALTSILLPPERECHE